METALSARLLLALCAGVVLVGTVASQDTHSVDRVKHLRVTTLQHPPFVMKSEKEDETKWRGMAMDILNEAVTSIGYDDVTILETEDNKFGSLVKKTGEWNGMIGNLVAEKADIAVGAISPRARRAAHVHFTQPFLKTGFRVLYKIPDAWNPSDSMGTLLRPFTPGLWVLLIVMFVLTSLGLYVIGRFSPFEEVAFIGKTATNEGLTLPNSLLYTFSSLVWQGHTAAPKSISGRILTCVWWIFCVFTVGAYIAGLCAILFRSNPEIRTLPFTTMEEMLQQTKVEIMITRDGSTNKYLENSNGRLEMKLYDRIRAKRDELMVENVDAALKKMMESDGKFALLLEGGGANYLATRPPCDKMVIGEPLGHSGVAFACRNNSDVCDKMDEQILMMQESGKMQEIEEKWFHRGCLEGKGNSYIFEGLPFFDTFGGEPDLITPLTITIRRFSCAFIVLCIGIVGAAICLGAEILYATRRGTAMPRKLERSRPDDDMERIDNDYRDERA